MPPVSLRALARLFRRRGRAVAAALALPLLLAACAARPVAEAPTAPDAAVAAAAQAAAEAEAPSSFAMALERHGLAASIPREGKAILVNIPSFELIAFEDGEPVLRSRVVVGRHRDRDRTPEMDAVTSVVRFRPTWRPTPLMVERDGYEDRVWPPGEGNPLGLLAIRLGPQSLIYLHGTNRPDLFDRDMRALSGGCVRVERWDEVAGFVLDLSPEAVRASAKRGATFDMETGGVPVMMRYHTEFPDAEGVMRRHADVYGWAPQAAPMQVAAAE